MNKYIIFFLFILCTNSLKPVQPVVFSRKKWRDAIIEEQGGACYRCRTKFSSFVPPELHHVDHNNKNNTYDNLLVLCSNCHSGHHRFGINISKI